MCPQPKVNLSVFYWFLSLKVKAFATLNTSLNNREVDKRKDVTTVQALGFSVYGPHLKNNLFPVIVSLWNPNLLMKRDKEI